MQATTFRRRSVDKLRKVMQSIHLMIVYIWYIGQKLNNVLRRLSFPALVQNAGSQTCAPFADSFVNAADDAAPQSVSSLTSRVRSDRSCIVSQILYSHLDSGLDY